MNAPQQSNRTMQPQPGPMPRTDGAERPALSELRKSVAEVTRILHVRRWMFFVPLCVVISAAFIASLYVPRRYRATTNFERRDDPVLINLQTLEGAGGFDTLARTLRQDVRNIESARQIVRELGLVERRRERPHEHDAAAPKPTDAEVRRIANRIVAGLDARTLQDSRHLDVWEISFTTSDPYRMTDILDAVRDKYISSARQRITDVLFQTKQWFENELQKRQSVVENMEDDLIRFRADHQGRDPLDTNTVRARQSGLLADLAELERKSKEFNTQIEGRRAFLNSGAAFDPGTKPPNAADVAARGTTTESAESRRLTAAMRNVAQNIDDLQTTRGMTDRHPEIIALNRKRDSLAAAFERIREGREDAISANGVTGTHEFADAPGLQDGSRSPEQARAEMEIGIFEKLAADNKADIERARTAIAEYEVIHGDALVQRKEFSIRGAEAERARNELVLYQGYVNQLGRVLAAENNQRGILFGKIKRATGSSNIPVSPRPFTVLVLTLAAGLTTSVVLVIVAEVLDRTIRTRRQVTAGLGLPILESIGVIMTAAARRRAFMSRMILVPATTTVLLGAVLVSGSMAFLSITNRSLYERAVDIPRAVLNGVVQVSGASPVGPAVRARHGAEGDRGGSPKEERRVDSQEKDGGHQG
ncbi:MAG: hypothetical protein V3W34_16320 [Phycisphaerae bacterium]